MSSGQKGGWFAAMVTAVLVAVLASGNRPWWLGGEAKQESKGPAPIHTGPAPEPQQDKAEAPEAAAAKTVATKTEAMAADASTTLSPEYMLGRWRAEQNNGAMSVSATTVYYENGRFEGHGTQVAGYLAQQMNLTGQWRMEKVSAKLFRLDLRFDNGYSQSINFKMLDKDHVQNLDMNYVAERVE